MFEIEPSPIEGPSGDILRVADHARGVWLQRVATHGRDPGHTFQLVRGNTPIALDTYGDERIDSSGQVYYFVQISSIGGSPIALRVAGIEPVTFSSEDEKDEVTELAAEALLVYGSLYDGLSRPEGQYRIGYSSQNGQRVATLATFGYLPS